MNDVSYFRFCSPTIFFIAWKFNSGKQNFKTFFLENVAEQAFSDTVACLLTQLLTVCLLLPQGLIFILKSG